VGDGDAGWGAASVATAADDTDRVVARGGSR